MQRAEGTSNSGSTHNEATSKCLSLPAEIWLHIIGFLVAPVAPDASTLPYPGDGLLGHLGSKGQFPHSPNKDILALALTCRHISKFARQALYRAPHLPTDKSLGLFSNNLALARTERYRWVAKEHLSFIRCLRLWDAKAERTGRKAMDHNAKILSRAINIQYLSMESSEDRRDAIAFLKSEDAAFCAPKRLTIKGTGSEPLAFSDRIRFSALSRLTHLHLIKAVPPSALISLLVGFPINVEVAVHFPDMLESIQFGETPRSSLECIRLSDLSPDTLRHFKQYIAYRESVDTYHLMPLSKRLKQHAPLPPTVIPSRSPNELAEQEALYDLAVNAATMPRLRLLILEVQRCHHRLPEPRNMLHEAQVQVSRDRRRYLSKEALGVIHRHDAPSFNSAIRKAAAGGEASILDVGMNLEREDWERFYGAAELDREWRGVQEGKLALIDLWNRCRRENASSDSEEVLPEMEIRVVAGRLGRWDPTELLEDCRCQSDNLAATGPTAGDRRAGEQEHGHTASSSTDHGSWRDADVFSLVETSPWLSYRKITHQPQLVHCYWTGELPRETNADCADPSSTVEPGGRRHIKIPSIIDLRYDFLDTLGRQEYDELAAEARRSGVDIDLPVHGESR